MKNRHLIISLLLMGAIQFVSAQKSTLWLTYGQSKFISYPGLEFNYLFKGKTGIQGGLSPYIIHYDTDQTVSALNENGFHPFYSANLGICRHLLSDGHHKLGGTIGGRVYFGSYFEPLHYYEDSGSLVYYDSFQNTPNLGVDFGLYYHYKRLSVLFKFDTALNNFGMGIGYAIL